MADLPKFDAPPVVEAVISLQFARLSQLTAAHVGWYWKEHLGVEKWTTVNEAALLEDVFELFGSERSWSTPGIKIETANPNVRLQFLSSNEEYMIQIQSSRFAYNWRQKGGAYPTFDELLPKFEEQFSRFRGFVRDSQGENLDLNQWEITYVNHLSHGDLWESAGDWGDVLPLLQSPVNIAGQKLESAQSSWHFVIGETAGRLHIVTTHGRKGGPDGPEVLTVNLTARGPIGEDGEFHDGLHLGHEHLVSSFINMTSEAAHKSWKRSR